MTWVYNCRIAVMKSRLMDTLSPPLLKVRWLLEPQAEPGQARTDQQESVKTAPPTGEETGQDRLEMLDLALGMHLCRVGHRFEPGRAGLQPMSDVVTELTEPLLFVQTVRSGRGVLQDRGLKVRLPHHPGVGIFQHLDHIDHQHWADTSAPIEVTALSIGESALQRALGEPTTAALYAGLGINTAPSARIHPLPQAITALLHACFADHLTGNLRALHAQAKVLDFLIALVGHCAGAVQPEPRKDRVIRQLREELNPWQDPMPSLAELAQRYALSERVMNETFQREYGQTLYAYITDLRLNAAHAALQSGNLPLKVLADRLGYVDVSHFSNAFTRRFGYRPGSVRREQK